MNFEGDANIQTREATVARTPYLCPHQKILILPSFKEYKKNNKVDNYFMFM
jgi:hypothetical protein